MTKRDLLAALLPPVAYSPERPLLNAELTAEGNAFDKSAEYARLARNGVTPLFAADLLADWERVLALVPAEDLTYQIRLQNVLIKLSETGGLSRPYFIRIAENAGYTITIDELDPFRADQNRAGDNLYEEDAIWVWLVNILGKETPSYYFRAGESAVNESLQDFGDSVIETWFNELKPAHTLCIFTYRQIPTGPYYDGSWLFNGERNYNVEYL